MGSDGDSLLLEEVSGVPRSAVAAGLEGAGGGFGWVSQCGRGAGWSVPGPRRRPGGEDGSDCGLRVDRGGDRGSFEPVWGEGSTGGPKCEERTGGVLCQRVARADSRGGCDCAHRAFDGGDARIVWGGGAGFNEAGGIARECGAG